jgi:hypothetical protein
MNYCTRMKKIISLSTLLLGLQYGLSQTDFEPNYNMKVYNPERKGLYAAFTFNMTQSNGTRFPYDTTQYFREGSFPSYVSNNFQILIGYTKKKNSFEIGYGHLTNSMSAVFSRTGKWEDPNQINTIESKQTWSIIPVRYYRELFSFAEIRTYIGLGITNTFIPESNQSFPNLGDIRDQRLKLYTTSGEFSTKICLFLRNKIGVQIVAHWILNNASIRQLDLSERNKPNKSLVLTTNADTFQFGFNVLYRL